ncbi:MAG TPA: pseudouridine-5'-phosphate glycosidase [Chloroflexota bacterium]|nr:pseudouridine-5'-phosphate glycosidase [Chloroflexota bacterium]
MEATNTCGARPTVRLSPQSPVPSPAGVQLAPDVARALDAGGPVVALESTLIAHGLPRPENLAVAREVEAIVREAGAVPATIAVLGGVPTVGLDGAALERIAGDPGVRKVSLRDLPLAMATGADGATTVASTAALAARCGIRLFATGGLGGVHRGARETWDESADLVTLSRTPLAVVCAGVKSILDVGATLERLESLNVAVAGFRTARFPGFYLADSGYPLEWTLHSEAEAAAAVAAQGLVGEGALVIANPIPVEAQLDPALHDRTLAAALAEAERRGVRGKGVTPFVLEYFHTATGGESRRVNTTIIRRNAHLAARIAVRLRSSPHPQG